MKKVVSQISGIIDLRTLIPGCFKGGCAARLRSGWGGVVVVGLSLALPAQARLVFPQTEINTSMTVGAESVWVEFPFANEGSDSAVLDEVQSSCGCTVPELTQKQYAPGEQGVLRARFDVGERQGMQTKQLTVISGGETTVLKFNVDVPQRSEFAPRLLLFRGDDLNPRSTQLTFKADKPVTLISVVSHNPAFTVEVIPSTEGESYELKVTLVGKPDAEQRGTLRVKSEGGSGREYDDLFYARYRP